MPSGVKDAMLSTSLGSLGAHLGEAAAAGGFDPPEARLSRQRFRLDAQGWAELAEELNACSRRIEALEEASDARCARDGATRPAPDVAETAPGSADPECASVVMLLFRAPPESKPA